MKIGFVGAGKVGTSLGLYFLKKGLTLSGYCDLDDEQAEKAAEKTGCKPYPKTNMLDLIKDSDIVMLTVQDTYIEALATSLSQQNVPFGKTYCHTSGALEAHVMEALRPLGGQLFSLHPLQAFADVEQALQALDETWFFLEGDVETLKAPTLNNLDRVPMQVLIEALPNEVRQITTGKKGAYHAAAVVASNYLMVLLKFSQNLMVEAGVPAHDAKALLPLIKSALNNFEVLGPEAALTGPIARGDAGTVAHHLEAIENMAVQKDNAFSTGPSWDELYRLLGKATLDLAQVVHLKNDDQIQAISTLLNKKTEAYDEK